jgi:hypothetical protein
MWKVRDIVSLQALLLSNRDDCTSSCVLPDTVQALYQPVHIQAFKLNWSRVMNCQDDSTIEQAIDKESFG